MQSVTLISILTVGVLTVLQAPQPASGVCCRSPGGPLPTFLSSGEAAVSAGGAKLGAGASLRYQVCNDCTRPTPYCGHGQCNIFGCNCDGGCREGRCQRRRRSIEGEDEPSYDNTAYLLSAGDMDADGALSIREARSLLQRDGVAVDLLALRDLDVDRDGKLSPEEIDSTY